MATVAIIAAACSIETCSCGAGGVLFVKLSGVEPGGSVEVCFEGNCGLAEIDGIDGTADEAEIALSSLGMLDTGLDSATEVVVTIFDRGGVEVRSGVVSPTSAENCCGVFWTANL